MIFIASIGAMLVDWWKLVGGTPALGYWLVRKMGIESRQLFFCRSEADVQEFGPVYYYDYEWPSWIIYSGFQSLRMASMPDFDSSTNDYDCISQNDDVGHSTSNEW